MTAKEQMTAEDWAKYVNFRKELLMLPEEKQRDLYFMSEGAKLVAEREVG